MRKTTSAKSFCGLKDPYSNKDTALFYVLPLPYEATTSYRKGTVNGPQAIIRASTYLELYDDELRLETYKYGIHTLPFLKTAGAGPHNISQKIADYVGKTVPREKTLITLGGEHSISPGLVHALKEKHQDLSVLHLDAHADLRISYQNNSNSHACASRRMLEIAPVVLAGIRSLSAEEADFAAKTKQNIFWGKEALENTAKIISLLSDTVYISLDIDILDPSVMPATGTPEPDGWLWRELTTFLKNIILRKKIAGIDIVELSPLKDNPAPDFTIAKLIYRLIGYITQTF